MRVSADDRDCPLCGGEVPPSAETDESPLRRAVGAPGLRGSRFVGSRGVRDVHVCRGCGVLWWSWVDQREGWRGIRRLGHSALAIFAADTSLARIAEWVASDYREELFRPVHELATLVVRRRTEGLAAGVESILSGIEGLATPDSELEAERLTMLFRLLTLVVKRAVRGDLRRPGPRAVPPRRWAAGAIAAEAARFEPREEEGLARLALTHDVARRLLWERRWGKGCRNRDEAVIAIGDVAPILRVIESVPFGRVAEGGRRGVFAAAAFEAASELVWRGLPPENDHAIWMSEGDRARLAGAVDPVVRLAGSVRRLLEACGDPSGETAEEIEMEATLVRVPIRLGARFSDDARARLTGLLGRLDGLAASRLRDILDLERKALLSDSNCVLSRDEPSGPGNGVDQS